MLQSPDMVPSSASSPPLHPIMKDHLNTPFMQPIEAAPLDIEKRFGWDTQQIDPINMKLKFDTFSKFASFSLTGAELMDTSSKSFEFCKKIYETILFPPNAPKLSYHDLNHALITSGIAQKMFLGGVANESSLKNLSKDQLSKLHSLVSLASSFHEIDDWWSLGYPDSKIKQNPHKEQAKTAIAQELTSLGLSTHDFNRLIILDDFKMKPEETVKKSIELKKMEGFLTDNKVPPLFDEVDKEVRGQLLTVASNALCAADFLQVVNPAYLQPIKMKLGDEVVNSFAGPVVLAGEMSKWRKNALKPAGFANTDGSVNWSGISLSPSFFLGYALERIRPGMPYLLKFSPEEFGATQDLLNRKTKYLTDTSNTVL